MAIMLGTILALGHWRWRPALSFPYQGQDMTFSLEFKGRNVVYSLEATRRWFLSLALPSMRNYYFQDTQTVFLQQPELAKKCFTTNWTIWAAIPSIRSLLVLDISEGFSFIVKKQTWFLDKFITRSLYIVYHPTAEKLGFSARVRNI